MDEQRLVDDCVQHFIDRKAENFIEINFWNGEIGDMSVTIQRTSGKTPGELYNDVSAHRDALLIELKEARDTIRAVDAAMSKGET